MSIIGIGTDLVSKIRIKHLMDRFPTRFAERILSPAERVVYQKQPSVDYLAKRFAAKEAVAKAFGTGIGTHVSLKEIEITNLPSGQPQVTLLGKGAQLASRVSAKHIHISITDEWDHALAFVVVERG